MYYYQGVQDWGWFYPFHYAPCASDLTNLQEFAGGQWELGAPFLPFTQLMAVFPPASGHALPKAYRQLMVTPNSPIIDFYPIDFKNDLNGKRHQWQAISLLPFIDAARLRAALAPLLPTLTAEEAGRNAFSSELLFTNTRSALGARCAKCAAKAGDADADEKPLALSPTSDESPGFGGEVRPAAHLRRADAPLPPPPGGRRRPRAGGKVRRRRSQVRAAGVLAALAAPPPRRDAAAVGAPAPRQAEDVT